MNSAPNSRQARAGRTQEKPPSFRREPSRTTARRSSLSAQLALMAEGKGPLLIAIASLPGQHRSDGGERTAGDLQK